MLGYNRTWESYHTKISITFDRLSFDKIFFSFSYSFSFLMRESVKRSRHFSEKETSRRNRNEETERVEVYLCSSYQKKNWFSFTSRQILLLKVLMNNGFLSKMCNGKSSLNFSMKLQRENSWIKWLLFGSITHILFKLLTSANNMHFRK